jgi:catechol 2,3-dioxygenase-like lactoylglutathione lyase family enzyme
MGLRHVALLTRNLERTEGFYTEVLGLQYAFAEKGMFFLRSPGSNDLLNFVHTKRSFDPAASGLDHFGLHLTRARWRRIRKRLKQAGIPIRGRRGRSAVYIEDPNGYTVELYAD